MTRALLIGTGPLPGANPRHVDFPRLRTWQILRGLLHAGADVHLVQAVPRSTLPGWHSRVFEGKRIRTLSVPIEALDRADLPERWLTESRADLVVSAGPFRPARAASRTPPGTPVLIDLPGDVMAEAHLRAMVTQNPEHISHARRLMDSVLARGDAFTVISQAQQHALFGQLALQGRLGLDPSQCPPVLVTPVAVEPLWQVWAAQGGPVPRQPHRILWPGSFNTWAATDLFLDACDIAMTRNPALRVIATGGPIANQAEEVHHSVAHRIALSPWKNRFRLAGALTAVEAAREVSRAAVGIMLDRPCVESILGSRTRLLYGAVLGLPWVLTPRCELATWLVESKLARAVPREDPDAVADVMLEAAEQTRKADPAVLEQLRRTWTVERTVAGIVAWIKNPESCPPPVSGIQNIPIQRLQELESALHEVQNSLTWRTLAPLHRLVRRLVRKR